MEPLEDRVLLSVAPTGGGSVSGTVFEDLDRDTYKDKFWVEEVENPVAVIERGMFGSWRLQVEGFDSDCKVKRIQ